MDIQQKSLTTEYHNLYFNPGPAEPGYALPLKTV